MAPPSPVVRSARHLWHCQWRLLMGGLGPADREGRYRRPAGAFTSLPPLPQDAAEPGAHVLIVGRSCPWAHRAWLTWSLRGLAGTIETVVVVPDPAAGLWRFREPFEGCSSLIELYRRCGAAPGSRATVPALYSRSRRAILVNESALLIDLLNAWPAAAEAPDLLPVQQRQAIQSWRERLQDDVNDGVYRCGFARNQKAYDEAESALFDALEALEKALAEPGGSGWLCGGAGPTLADVVLFPTLIRMELVYAPLFGCSRRPLWQLPRLWDWRQRFHALPGVAGTCFPDAWRADYFGSLFPLHPSGIVPAGPDLATLVGSPSPAAPGSPDR